MPNGPALQCWTIELPGDRAVDVFIHNMPDDEAMLDEILRNGGESAYISYVETVPKLAR